MIAFRDIHARLSAAETALSRNPTLLVEVTSRSTEDYDRGEKLRCYKLIPSLETLLVVSHRLAQVTVFERTDSGWAERQVAGGQNVSLQTPKIEFAVDELYRGIQLE